MAELPQRLIDQGIRRQLAEQVEIIQKNIDSVIEIGNALQAIRDEKLYRLDYKTFDDFCKDQFGFGRTKAKGLIEQVSPKQLTTSQVAVMPQNGSTETGEVANSQSDAIEKPSANGDVPPEDKPPAVLVESIPPEPPQDPAGNKIPHAAKPAFDRAEQLEEWGRKLDSLMRDLKPLTEGPGTRLIDYETARIHIKNGKMTVLQNRATHVCPLCHGKKMVAPCKCCLGEAWTAGHVYKRLTEEVAK